MSHPTGVRGLKLAGLLSARHCKVAPHGGAWIETEARLWRTAIIESHPTGVRGLKPIITNDISDLIKSHPTGVRGLKLEIVVQRNVGVGSHPTGVRGLKHRKMIGRIQYWSRTPRGCVD